MSSSRHFGCLKVNVPRLHMSVHNGHAPMLTNIVGSPLCCTLPGTWWSYMRCQSIFGFGLPVALTQLWQIGRKGHGSLLSTFCCHLWRNDNKFSATATINQQINLMANKFVIYFCLLCQLAVTPLPQMNIFFYELNKWTTPASLASPSLPSQTAAWGPIAQLPRCLV